MTWTTHLFFLLMITCCSFCHAKNSKNQPLKQQQSQVSEDLAHVIWNIMATYEGEYNFQELMLNLKKIHAGRIQAKPLKDCYASLITSLNNKVKEKEILTLQEDIHEIYSFIFKLRFN